MKVKKTKEDNMTVKHWNTGASAERYREGERASKQASKQAVNKDMVQYWLGDDYENWIDDILIKLVNDENPSALYNLKKEIKDAWDQHLE
jgi:hypothetical protein